MKKIAFLYILTIANLAYATVPGYFAPNHYICNSTDGKSSFEGAFGATYGFLTIDNQKLKMHCQNDPDPADPAVRRSWSGINFYMRKNHFCRYLNKGSEIFLTMGSIADDSVLSVTYFTASSQQYISRCEFLRTPFQ